MFRSSLSVVALIAVSFAGWISSASAATSPYFVNNFEADTPNTGDRFPNTAFMYKQDYVHTQTYDENGGMTKPTFATQSGDGGAAATAGGNYHVNDTGFSGFNTNNVALFAHPSRFGGGREGVVRLRNTANNNPFAGTNTGGFLWDFDMSLDPLSVQATSGWTVKPAISLQSNFGTDGINNGYNDLVRVRWDNGNIVLDHAGGTTTLVSNYTTASSTSVPYHLEAQLDMDTDTYRMAVNGTIVGTFSMLFAGNATRGIGGYEIRGGQPDDSVTSNFEGFMSYYDNLTLAVPEPSSAVILGIVGMIGLRRRR